VLLECNLIKKHAPRYNVLLRDDKSYPYILITTQHPFPRIDLYRGQRKKGGRYFGPYPSSLAVRETISLLQKLFHLRTCADSYYEARSRPCLLYQIGRCSGPCVGHISQTEYDKNVKMAILFLEGKNEEVIEHLHQQMEHASSTMNFELAAHYRDQIARLRQIQERQYVNVKEGNADIIGLAIEAGVICIQLLCIRGGQVLGSRSYFPLVPIDTSQEEILTAFIKQHYLRDPTHVEQTPQQILVGLSLPERVLLSEVLSTHAHHKVAIMQPLRGDKTKWITMATASARQSLSLQLFAKMNVKERMLAVQKIFELKRCPQRIECFDISHSMGEATVASCVVFDLNGAVKSDYRLYNIKDVTPGDDVAAMRQVLLRRFKRLQKEAVSLPEIVLIDGGKAQLAAADDVMRSLDISSVLLVGVSKGPDRKPGFETIHRLHYPPMHLPADSLALHFIQQIRDEAHRFAITGHRQRRDKARRQSPLEMLPGIGAKRRRELLRYFGGIQGIAHASLEELMKVPGISRSLAERIFTTLHDATL
jgi:excinuclease ABC subunit C